MFSICDVISQITPLKPHVLFYSFLLMECINAHSILTRCKRVLKKDAETAHIDDTTVSSINKA